MFENIYFSRFSTFYDNQCKCFILCMKLNMADSIWRIKDGNYDIDSSYFVEKHVFIYSVSLPIQCNDFSWYVKFNMADRIWRLIWGSNIDMIKIDYLLFIRALTSSKEIFPCADLVFTIYSVQKFIMISLFYMKKNSFFSLATIWWSLYFFNFQNLTSDS